MIVTKDVDNTLGGTASPSDFTLSVTGNNPSQSTFQGSSSGTTIIIGPGSYQINVVSGPPNYDQAHTHHRCDIGTISAGQTITCTIINQFKPPADTQPPQVVSFTVNPMRISLSSGGTAIITAHVTDQTAVDRVGVYVQDQCGNSPGFFQSLRLPLVSGTAQDGIYQATFTFPQLAYDNVVQSCSPNGIDAYFEAGGSASDTLGHLVGLPLIINIVLTR